MVCPVIDNTHSKARLRPKNPAALRHGSGSILKMEDSGDIQITELAAQRYVYPVRRSNSDDLRAHMNMAIMAPVSKAASKPPH